MKAHALGSYFLLVAGCFGCSEAAPSAPARVVEYAWRSTGGPCKPEEPPCIEVLQVAEAQRLTRNLRGNVLQATLSSADQTAFAEFVADEQLRAVVVDTPACTPMPVLDSMIRIELLREDETREIAENLTACTGATFDRIDEWTTRLRLYFPEP